MVDRLLQLMPRVFRHEGGYADHPRDPGGATNHGITHLTLARHRGVERVSRAQVKALTKREATAIYRSSFWERVQGGALPIGVDYAVLDASINSGPGRGVRWLQKAIGAKPDGKVGPVTRRLVAAADAAAVVENMLDRREAFLRRLKTFDAFGRGWMRRVDAVRRDALADIERARGTPEERVAAQVETILNPPSPLLPAARPRQSGHVTRALLETYRSLLPTAYRHAGVVVLFVRGYFSHSFGRAGNDRGVSGRLEVALRPPFDGPPPMCNAPMHAKGPDRVSPIRPFQHSPRDRGGRNVSRSPASALPRRPFR